MQKLNSYLVTVPFPDKEMNDLVAFLAPAKVTICGVNDKTAIDEALLHADAAILGGDIPDQIMEGKHLKWIHCDHSGLTYSARQDVFDRGIVVTGSAGRSAPTLAEHAILFMLALTYDLQALQDLQRAHRWGGLPGYNDRRGLIGKTAGIVGVGHTGKELAKRLKAMGMTVLGYRRRKEEVECVDEMYAKDAGDTLEPLLERCDYLILTTQLSDETFHLIDKDAIEKMKPSAYIVNMCRGSVIDEAALESALRSGRIAGAGLDTTEIEPLPEESTIWDAPNVIITPHNTPTVPNRWARSYAIISENARRYSKGEAMLNQITIRDLYSRKRP